MVANLFRTLFVFIVIALAMTATSGRAAGELSAADAKKYFNEKGCNACHAVDEVRIGPSFRMISLRYSAEVAAEGVDKLAKKIVYGGAGAWGNVPMVSNPSISQLEAESVARWIMALQKGGKP